MPPTYTETARESFVGEGVDAPKKVTPSPSLRRIPSLDGLRGVSIWAVMLAHASNHYLNPNWRHAIGLANILSYFGVTTFFIISGFLITKLLLKERARTSRIDLGRFYRRRSARILPASLFYILVVGLVAKVTVAQIFYALTFTTSYFFDQAAKPLQQLWSLSVEEQFYLLWPLAIYLGIRGAKRYCWAIMIASPIVRLVLRSQGSGQYIHMAPAIGDSVAAGCLLAFYEDRVSAFARKHLTSTAIFILLCLGTTTIACIVYRFDLIILWGISNCLLALTISVAIERKDAILNGGFLVWSGLLSYSLYLWQQPFLVFDGPFNNFLARILMTFLLAYISYRFVEQPALQIFNGARRGLKPARAAMSIE
jgi:peptidoglycan/LPS O-acetylase OafA/YrhL